MNMDIAIVKCTDYSKENVSNSLEELLTLVGGLDWVTPGMKIVIKVNLVAPMKPDAAGTTHPALLCELVKRLCDKGAEVIVGDSPGGIYTSTFVNKVYSTTGMSDIIKVGGKLNQNFEQKTAFFENGKVLKEFEYTSFLDEADVIINFCKLKTHGMMGMSAATKNLFGTIPGTLKPEYHFKYPNHFDFADMLIDLNEYFKPKLCIVDAVVGMEGNGPTMGKPRHIGAILASTNPYKLDLACAKIIGLTKENVTTLEAAFKRNLIPSIAEELSCNDDLNNYIVENYDNITVRKSLWFEDKSTLTGRIITKLLQSKTILDKKTCIGCKKCFEICPAKAIIMKNNKPVINRKKCISCFCCQEFCPKGAMKVKRPVMAKLLNNSKKNNTKEK